MDTRRHHHHGSGGGGRGHNGSHRRGRGGRGGRGGGGHSAGRGSNWFKGEGYNDYEAVSIDEEAVGISGFLSPTQPGFSGLVKQRFSDFIVHEIARNGQPVVLTSLATKKKNVSAHFQELVASYVFGAGTAAYSATAAASAKSDPVQTACLLALQDIGEALGRHGYELQLQGCKAMEAHDLRKLIELVTAELGKKKGKDFADFVAQVAARKLTEAKRLAAAQVAAVAAASDSLSVTSAAEPLAATAYTAPQEPSDELVFYIGGLNEKRERVFLHETMRRYGKTLIVADTITSEDQSQVIRVRRAFAPGEIKKGERDPRTAWPVDQPEYLQFVLYRRNKDIVPVVNQLASLLKVSPSIFSYAEPKDKRGITTQFCTAHRLPIERLQQLQKFHSGRSLDEYQYLIGGNLKYVSNKVALGDCRGNRFSIVIRALADSDLATPQAVDAAITHWCARGFVNFFGLQRFGNYATPSHLIGRAVLRKDFKLAVLLLLRPQDGEASKLREAREHFRQHKDVAAALRMLPPFLVPERAVLEGLLQHGIDANELAFRCIPLSYRVAYVDAYLNYVWNEMASLRVAQLSVESPVVGDLVLAKAAPSAQNTSNEPAKKKQKLTSGSSAAAATGGAGAKAGAPALRDVIVLTDENVGEYTIKDVVLPLPGYSVVFPANAVGVAYQKMLTTDGVDMASWLGAGAQLHQYQQLGGAYRHLIKKPSHVSAHVREYESMSTPLVLTDVDRLLKRSLNSVGSAAARAAPAPVVESAGTAKASPSGELPSSPPSANDASSGAKRMQRALVLEFTLDVGSDATIAVRELMKQSSSMHVQWQLADRAQGESSHAAAGAGVAVSKSALQTTSSNGAKRPKPGRGVQVGASIASANGGNKKIIAQKKTQVSIGRPGFSLGKH